MAKRGGSGGAVALWGLGVLVAALIVSWGWTTFGPHTRGARRSGKHVVRVQVLNGSGEPGVGTRVAAYLREGGFQVTDVRTFPSRAKCLIIWAGPRSSGRSGVRSWRMSRS